MKRDLEDRKQNVEKIYKIIAVDDEESFLNSLQILQKKTGYELVCVTDTIEAIELIKKEHFDLMILDFVMPPYQGEQVVKEIRKYAKDLYILLITRHKDLAPSLEIIKQLDIQGYCEKSRKLDQLILLIESAVKSIEQMREIKEINEELSETYDELEKSYLDLVETLRYAVEAKDTYTRGHSDRVSAYSVLLGEKLGLSSRKLKVLKIGGIFHDVGKIGIPDRILLKDDKLTIDEYDEIKKHPIIGAEILSSVSYFKDMIPIVKYHHEKYDGTGYPENLKGEEIPYLARIVAVADSFDAMTSKRSYRNSLSTRKVKSEIEKGKGTQFDPNIADAMLDILVNEPEKIKEVQKKFNPQVAETV